MLILHVIFGLLIYPVTLLVWKIQNSITFRETPIKSLLLNPVVYWGFRVAIVLLWIFWGMLFGHNIGLYRDSEFPNALDDLSSIYMVAWDFGVDCLTIKAHWEVEKSYRTEIEG